MQKYFIIQKEIFKPISNEIFNFHVMNVFVDFTLKR